MLSAEGGKLLEGLSRNYELHGRFSRLRKGEGVVEEGWGPERRPGAVSTGLASVRSQGQLSPPPQNPAGPGGSPRMASSSALGCVRPREPLPRCAEARPPARGRQPRA